MRINKVAKIWVSLFLLVLSTANALECGDTLSSNYTMDSDLICNHTQVGTCSGYNGSLCINSSMTLDCAGHKIKCIDCGNSAGEIYGIVTTADLTIRNCSIEGFYHSPIHYNSNLQIYDSRLEGWEYNGKDCYNNNYGIYFTSGDTKIVNSIIDCYVNVYVGNVSFINSSIQKRLAIVTSPKIHLGYPPYLIHIENMPTWVYLSLKYKTDYFFINGSLYRNCSNLQNGYIKNAKIILEIDDYGLSNCDNYDSFEFNYRGFTFQDNTIGFEQPFKFTDTVFGNNVFFENPITLSGNGLLFDSNIFSIDLTLQDSEFTTLDSNNFTDLQLVSFRHSTLNNSQVNNIYLSHSFDIKITNNELIGSDIILENTSYSEVCYNAPISTLSLDEFSEHNYICNNQIINLSVAGSSNNFTGNTGEMLVLLQTSNNNYIAEDNNFDSFENNGTNNSLPQSWFATGYISGYSIADLDDIGTDIVANIFVALRSIIAIVTIVVLGTEIIKGTIRKLKGGSFFPE